MVKEIKKKKAKEKEKLKKEIEKELKKEMKRKKPILFRMFFGSIKGVMKFLIWALIAVIITIITILVISTIAAFLAYNFISIKTGDLCLGTAEDLGIACNSESDCSDAVFEDLKIGGEIIGESGGQNIGEGLDMMEGFLKDIFDKSTSCKNNSCQIRKVRGIREALGISQEKIECSEDEETFPLEITPKMIIPPEKIMDIIKKIISSKGKILESVKEVAENEGFLGITN